MRIYEVKNIDESVYWTIDAPIGEDMEEMIVSSEEINENTLRRIPEEDKNWIILELMERLGEKI